MGLFGKSAAGFSSPSSWADRLAILGATLRDASPDSRGDALQSVMAMQGARAQKAEQDGFYKQLIDRMQPGYQDGPAPNVRMPGLIGGIAAAQGMSGDPTGLMGATADVAAPQGPAAQFQPPTRTPGLNANSPDLGTISLMAQRAGVKITDLLDVLKMQQPNVNYDRGYGYNQKTGDPMGAYHADMDKGQTPTFGAGGAVTGVSNLPGAVQSASDMAGSITAAQEAAKSRFVGPNTQAQEASKAPYNFQTIKGPDGNPLVISTATAAALGSKGGMIGKGQSPAEEAAARLRAEAQAGSQVSLASDVNTLDTSIETAIALRNHPALNMRTGGWSMLPAVPGTPGAAFEAYKSQVLGQGWLDARQALKGAGSVTDYEGKKAEQAKMRMAAAQTDTAFKAGVDDYIASLTRARDLVRRKAGAGAPATQHAPTAADYAAEMRRRGLK